MKELIQALINQGIITAVDIQRMTTLELLLAIIERVNELHDLTKEGLEAVQRLLDKGVQEEVVAQFDKWLQDGTFDKLLNQSALKKVNDRIDETNAQLSVVMSDVCVIKSSMTIDEINLKLMNGGTFVFKAGIYEVTKESPMTPSSNSRLIFEPGAIIKEMTLDQGKYTILDITDCENVIIEDVTIIGSKENHIGTGGEWGYGIEITGSKDIKIIRPNISKTWGDGIYVGYKWLDYTPAFTTSNIFIDAPVIDDCSRNGISICCVDNIYVRNPKISNVKRTDPKAGIDIEPEASVERLIHLSDVLIEGGDFKNNGVDYGIVIPDVEGLAPNVSITNHKGYGCAVGVSVWNWRGNGKLLIDNLEVTPIRHGILVEKRTGDAILDFRNITINQRLKQSTDEDYTTASAIYLEALVPEVKNIIFTNVVIKHDDSNYIYKTIFATEAKGNIFKNLVVNGFKVIGYKATSMRLVGIDKDTCSFENIDLPLTQSYYRLDISQSSFNTKIICIDNSSWELTHTLGANIPNGEYEFMCLNNKAGYKFIIDDSYTIYGAEADTNEFYSTTPFAKYKVLVRGNSVYILDKLTW